VLTPLEISEYKKRKGKFCPYCNSGKICTSKTKGELKIVNPDRATQEMKCKSCRKVWLEIYPFFDIEEVGGDEKK